LAEVKEKNLKSELRRGRKDVERGNWVESLEDKEDAL